MALFDLVHFTKEIFVFFHAVLYHPLWQTFVSCLKVYQLSLIQGAEDPYAGIFDSDGAEKSLESFIIQASVSLLHT